MIHELNTWKLLHLVGSKGVPMNEVYSYDERKGQISKIEAGDEVVVNHYNKPIKEENFLFRHKFVAVGDAKKHPKTNPSLNTNTDSAPAWGAVPLKRVG